MLSETDKSVHNRMTLTFPHLCDVLRIVKFIEKESKNGVVRRWSEGGGELASVGDQVSVLQDDQRPGDGRW